MSYPVPVSMEEKVKDNVCSLYSDEDFANHITINLFKKKNNLRVSRISTSKREARLQNVSQNNSIKIRQNSLRPRNIESSQLNIQPNISLLKSSQHCNAVEINLTYNSCDYLNQTLNRSVNYQGSNISDQISNKIDDRNLINILPLNQEIKENTNLQQKNYPKNNFLSNAKSHSNGTVTSPPSTVSDDLTPLSWLQSLDMGGVVPHLAAPPTPPASPLSNQNMMTSEGTYQEPNPPPPEKIDYSVDGSVKPPYSYAALIGMAMKENDNKMTLSAIYKWIKEHFVFYKTADQSWQNSIRHNLSLNKCFLKVARSKDEPGKGGFWKLDPEYADSLVDGVFKKRRPSKGTAPPTTKTKRKRPLPYSQQVQIQNQVETQRQKEKEELMRQKEQEEAVRSLLQPVQASYMPPPTDKPPSIAAMYIQQDPNEHNNTTTLLVDEGGNPLKEDFVWSSILGDEGGHDECWQLSSQEVVTDLTQSGDPSTYQVTMSPTSSITSLSSSTSSILYCQHPNHGQEEIVHPLHVNRQHAQTLPSFELSPESLGVEEDLFGSPEYSEASNDERDSLIPSFDLGVGLDLAVSTTWENKTSISCSSVYDDIGGKECARTLEINENEDNILMNMEGTHQELVELHDLEGNLTTQLTTLEPVAPVVVQQINSPQCCWSQEQNWDEAKTFSFLEANIDFDKLIDLDVI